MKVTLGCDPELFLQDVDGALRSSIGRVGGSKYQPRPLEELGDGFIVSEDNVAVEFGVPPASSMDEWNNNINATIAYIEDKMQQYHGLHFTKLSAAIFPATELEHPGALVFGCEPDFNAWTGNVNPRPSAVNQALRSAGGHIHFGVDLDEKAKIQLVKMADLYLGVPSVVLDVDGAQRRELYGKRGAYRIKPYGVEYRTLSNFWVFSESLRKWAFQNSSAAVDALINNNDVDSLDKAIEEAINNNNVGVARELINQFNIPMPV